MDSRLQQGGNPLYKTVRPEVRSIGRDAPWPDLKVCPGIFILRENVLTDM